MDEDYIQRIQREAAENSEKRHQQREELLNKPIKAEERLVAWIDILGFKHEMEQVKTDADLQKAYRKMLYVHEQFNKETASDDPLNQANINKTYGRRILALSDGIVVAAENSKAVPARDSMTQYDLLMSLVPDLIEAQAGCSLRGIFLRGGISEGQFYFENDILLSAGLVRAYTIESTIACYPVVLIERKLVDDLRTLDGYTDYALGCDPSEKYFLPFERPDKRDEGKYYYLDYIGYIADPGNHGFFSEEDRVAAFDKGRDPKVRDRIHGESLAKSALRCLQRHKDKVSEAYTAITDEKVKKKYEWLIDYHNRTIKESGSFYDSALI